MAHVGIFGPTLCGKTTLAKHLSREYRKAGYASLVLMPPDMKPKELNWGPHAKVTQNTDVFEKWIWQSRFCMVFVEEASSTVKRDREKMEWFTRIRHRDHLLHIMGHGAPDILPGQRKQITTLFLFRQDEESADYWARQFTDKRILQAAELDQYEFLECRMFKEPIKRRLKIV